MWSFFQFLNDDCTLTILDIGAAKTGVPNYQNPIGIKRARLIGFEPDVDQCRGLNESYGRPHRFLSYFDCRAGAMPVLMGRMNSAVVRRSPTAKLPWRISRHLKFPSPQISIWRMAK
ncbi:MAG: hypothetical protein U1A72_16085 [Sulfuritalea sp.]|nr:hypothetical protein [Sulfuritalea sp.]